MIIDFNQEGFLFDTFDSEGTPNAAQGNGGAPRTGQRYTRGKTHLCTHPLGKS